MDTVQSLLGMSPAAAPQHQAGTVSVSAHEVQQLRAELQKQQAYINVKNEYEKQNNATDRRGTFGAKFPSTR